MTITLETQMPDPAAMRLRATFLDGQYVDYQWIQTVPGGRIEWELTHDLNTDTWTGTIDGGDATQAQIDALFGCLTDEEKADAADEAEEYREAREQREAAVSGMRGMR